MHDPCSPIGSADGVDSTIRVKKEALEVLGDRLQHLYAHDALCLLRHVFSLPKMLYTLHTSPCFLSPELELFDQLQRKLLGSIANIDLFVNDRAWAQASLPVWSGCLGIRSVAQLAPSAFLASAAGSSDLSHQLLPPRLRDATYPEQKEALRVWTIGHQEDSPSATACTHQKSWDTPIVNVAYDQLLESAPDDMSRARLLAAHTRESGAWLNAQHWDCAWMMILFVFLWAFVLELPCACLMFAITAGLKLANSAPTVSAAIKVKAVTPVTQASTASSRGICLQQESQPTLNPLAYAVLMANVLMLLQSCPGVVVGY